MQAAAPNGCQPMQDAATTWTFASADNRLAELMKACGCADVIAPVDAEAFGKRAGELLTRVMFSTAWLARVVSGEQHVLRDALKIDRVRPGGPPHVRMPSRNMPGVFKQ
jgi:hypothetical protein